MLFGFACRAVLHRLGQNRLAYLAIAFREFVKRFAINAQRLLSDELPGV